VTDHQETARPQLAPASGRSTNPPETSLGTVTLGDVTITPVYEERHSRLPRQMVYPDVDAQLWRDNHDLLVPDFWDPDADEMLASMLTWVLRSQGRTILVDTGIGNDKDRPGMPTFHRLDTDYIANLAAAGVRPEDVDIVVATHVHGDHVGWNTTLRDGEWVPTFPRASYVISRADFDYWNPENANSTRSGPLMQNVFEDSVAPVHRSGQTVLWEGSHQIDANLSLEPAPGHTPGSATLTLQSGSDRAVFVGDLLHSPLQIVEPDVCPCFDEDEAKARESRHRILGSIADTNALMLTAHLPYPSAAEIRRNGSKYAIQAWASF
jgi:glyoxylase-like metal-dependent hydrolase (beta-lactamase superfamily II)